ncbi:MAG TPA: histidinol-phosphatase HisJ [Bacteroidota bacterium]|nr:histidinol-phosphatase HisJ [Bacteroidota bacterium]
MNSDLHTHTYLCKHADGTAEEYIKKAVEYGFDIIGCTDHAPMPDDYDAPHRMTLEQFYTDYKPSVLELRERYRSEIDVKFGVESDFFPGTEDWVRAFNDKNDFDYVIGSVHYLGEWGFDNPVFIHRYDEQNVDEIYTRYFEHIRRSAQSGLFDILGHCDLVKKFGHRPQADMEEILRETLRAVKAADVVIEINTSGLRKPVAEVYPGENILAIARELEIPLTLGSDAHTPGDVGRDFETGRALIERYGRGMVSVFTKRQRSQKRIA